jgi:hypothetical protein
MAAQTTASIPGELKQYVALITSDQPEFRSLVESLLTPQQLTDYAPVIPYGVVIQNISGAPLRGYGLAFVQQPSTGSPMHDTYSPVDNAITPRGMFLPGQRVFRIPGVQIAPALRPGQTGAYIQRVLPPGVAPSPTAIAQQLAASSITASVEFVVTQAGKILGPDRFQDAKNIQSHEQALMDLANRVRSHGNDMIGLAADLQVVGQTRSTDPPYGSTLRSQARRLLALITQGNDPEGSVQNFLRGPGSGIVISR